MPLVLALNFLEVLVQAVEALLPEPPIMFDPLVHVLQRPRLELARPPLGLTTAGDQSGALEHLEVLRNPGKADFEGRRQFIDGSLSARESPEDRPPRRVGQRRERGTQLVWHYFTA